MELFCFHSLFRRVDPFLLQKFLSFSSSPARAGYSSFFSGNSNGGSTVYRRILQTQPPATISRRKAIANFVSFIGSIVSPVKKYATRYGRLGVYTMLEVKSSRESDRTFRIQISMWEELAEISLEHLRPSDCVYVSGYLDSYTRNNGGAKPEMVYKVAVKELNYVTNRAPQKTCKKPEDCDQNAYQTSKNREENEETLPTSRALDQERVRLHLWQIFFANPYEWWDNRQRKNSPNSADFRHKSTREALWLRPGDPPWVKKQLELHDRRMKEQGERDFHGARSRVSIWEYND